MILTHTVTAQEAGLTLQQLLRGPMALSGRQTRNAKAQGAVTVDAAPFFSNQRLAAGMVVRVVLDDYGAVPGKVHPENAAPLEIVFEDDALLAVFKPALLQCHPSPSAPGGSDTLEGRVRAYLGATAHPVHRLDSETTGLVLFARLPYAQAHLQQQMASGAFHKTYEAWVLGCPEPPEGEIDAPIARVEGSSLLRRVDPNGKPAVSRYRVLETAEIGGQPVSRLALWPLTGRTHQLRLHCACLGCPILGDPQYAAPASAALSAALGLGGQQLCATELRFLHPMTGAMTEIRTNQSIRLDFCHPPVV